MSALSNSERETTVVLDVGGKRHRTTLTTLHKLPHTKLARLATQTQHSKDSSSVELFFDRNPKIIHSLLDLYRTGELHLPGNMCREAVAEELKFWEIPPELIKECCWGGFHSHQANQEVVAEIDRFLKEPYPDVAPTEKMAAQVSWRRQIWLALERPEHSVASKIWSCVFFVFVFMAILSFTLETVRKFRVATATFVEHELTPNNWTLDQAYVSVTPVHFMAATIPNDWLHYLRYSTFAFFLLDFFLRLVTCPDIKIFFRQPRNWLELMVAANSSLHFMMESHVLPNGALDSSDTEKNLAIFLYTMSGVRAFRIFYLANHFQSMKMLFLCFKSSVRELLMLVVCVLSFVLLFGTTAYLAEVLGGLHTFTSIPAALWWAVVTMTTVGYGDLVPGSPGGQAVGALCALSGVVVMALPIAIIASKFTAYNDNISPWNHLRTRATFLKAHPQFDPDPDPDPDPGPKPGSDLHLAPDLDRKEERGEREENGAFLGRRKGVRVVESADRVGTYTARSEDGGAPVKTVW